MNRPDRRAGYDLLEQIRGLEFQVVEAKAEQVGDIVTMEIRLRMAEEDVEISAFGLVFAIAVLSFGQATPAGGSVRDYRADDEWSVRDFLRHLSFRRGRLSFYADYVRGRLMKTGIEVERDGTVTIRTVNRGEAPRRWVEALQGRDLLSLIDEKGLGEVQ
jgi:hypothetical protein